MLVKPHSLFAAALEEGWALGAFNTSNLELTQAIIWAAEEAKSPVIAQTSEGAIEYGGLKVLAGMVRQLAEEASVPVVLHLDHGKSFEQARACIDAGYTSVMIDASSKSLEENMRLTKTVVDYAHERGVWVEAELGAILGKEGAMDLQGAKTPEAFLTDPDQAEQFVRETGLDALAVSVGTIHGAFSGQEYIRFELLQELEKRLPGVPLVVHGASGISDDHLKKAARASVCKVNVDTELRIAFERAVKAYFDVSHDMIDPRKILGPAREAVQDVVMAKMRLFGSDGKVKV